MSNILWILLPFGILVASVAGIDLSRLYGHNGVQKRSGKYFNYWLPEKINGIKITLHNSQRDFLGLRDFI